MLHLSLDEGCPVCKTKVNAKGTPFCELEAIENHVNSKHNDTWNKWFPEEEKERTRNQRAEQVEQMKFQNEDLRRLELIARSTEQNSFHLEDLRTAALSSKLLVQSRWNHSSSSTHRGFSQRDFGEVQMITWAAIADFEKFVRPSMQIQVSVKADGVRCLVVSDFTGNLSALILGKENDYGSPGRCLIPICTSRTPYYGFVLVCEMVNVDRLPVFLCYDVLQWPLGEEKFQAASTLIGQARSVAVSDLVSSLKVPNIKVKPWVPIEQFDQLLLSKVLKFPIDGVVFLTEEIGRHHPYRRGYHTLGTSHETESVRISKTFKWKNNQSFDFLLGYPSVDGHDIKFQLYLLQNDEEPKPIRQNGFQQRDSHVLAFQHQSDHPFRKDHVKFSDPRCDCFLVVHQNERFPRLASSRTVVELIWGEDHRWVFVRNRPDKAAANSKQVVQELLDLDMHPLPLEQVVNALSSTENQFSDGQSALSTLYEAAFKELQQLPQIASSVNEVRAKFLFKIPKFVLTQDLLPFLNLKELGMVASTCVDLWQAVQLVRLDNPSLYLVDRIGSFRFPVLFVSELKLEQALHLFGLTKRRFSSSFPSNSDDDEHS